MTTFSHCKIVTQGPNAPDKQNTSTASHQSKATRRRSDITAPGAPL